MLKSRGIQKSFLDTEQFVDRLIPADSFYRQFRELVWPLICDEDFETLYCTSNGRPAISPSLLAMAMLLQFHENLSDREMESACRYDLRIKFALGLTVDERPFDHSSLGDFRARLMAHQKEKDIFDRILNKLIVEGLIGKDEPQRIDATHVIADIAIPSMITLVKKGVAEVLKPLGKRHAEPYRQVAKNIDLSKYTQNAVNQNHPGRPDEAKRERHLVDAVRDARKVIAAADGIEGDPILRRRLDMLKRILRENIEEGPDGTPKEKDYKAKPKDLLVSPIDPDARYGAKSVSKHFTGYKANITETTGGHFITNVKAMPGNRPDGETMVEAVTEQQAHDLRPTKIVGDTAYGDGSYRKALGDHGTIVVAPLRDASPRTKAIYPKNMFQHDEAQNTLTCPADVTVKEFYFDAGRETHMFHFPMTACGPCEHRPRCTNSREKRRVVGITDCNKELRAAEIYNRTDAFRQDMRLRPPVEGKLSELVRYHGLRRARYRGLAKLQLQCCFTAAAVNVKRWAKLHRQRDETIAA